jgi:hypothetical protein
MKKKLTLIDGTMEELEGTPEELAEFERRQLKISEEDDQSKKSPRLLTDEKNFVSPSVEHHHHYYPIFPLPMPTTLVPTFPAAPVLPWGNGDIIYKDAVITCGSGLSGASTHLPGFMVQNTCEVQA